MFAIQKTQQITKAIEMVSITKIFKIKKRMSKINPFIDKLSYLINVILKNNCEYDYLCIDKRYIRRVVFFIISSDKGLCSNLNTNLFHKILSKIKYFNERNIKVDLIIVGNKAYIHFNKLKFNILHFLTDINYNFSIFDFTNIIDFIVNLYINEKIDRLYLAFNKFKSSVCYIPSLEVILPLSIKINSYDKWDYIYEFNKKAILCDLIFKYIKANIFYFILENMLSEQSSRVLVMRNAKENIISFMKKLKLTYNNIRQNKITQELIEIISG